MGRTRPVRTLLRELKENSRSIEKSKKEYSNYLQRLKENYSQGKISYSRYVEILHTKRDGRNIHEWIGYLNKYEGDCKKEIKKLEIKKTARNIAALIFSFAFIGFLFVLFSNSNFTFTGFTVQDQIQESSQKLNLEFAESGTYEWQINEIGKLSSVKLSGSAEGNGTAQVYLGELLVFEYSGEINQEEVLQNGTSPSQEEPLPSSVKTFSKVCQETCDLEGLNLNDSSYSLRIEISGIKLNLEEITYEIISEADAENTEDTTNTGVIENENTTEIQSNQTIQETPIKETEQEVIETPQNISSEIPPETNLTEEIISETNRTEEITTETSATIQTIQYQAVLGKPVKWKKQISPEDLGELTIKLPKEAENIKINEINEQTQTASPITGAVISGGKSSNLFMKIFEFFKARLTGHAVQEQENNEIEVNLTVDEVQNYEIEYETPAPYAIEKDMGNGKEVTIVGPETIHYENVLSFTELDEKLKIKSPSQVKIYWKEENSFVQIQNLEDTNGNGIYDYIEWVTPHLSNQTFQIIIEITKAAHLDENKNFISDIYEQVVTLDGVWSEEIPNKDYVRITFKKNLTSGNDITIFPRIVSGTPIIEVYEKDKSEMIAEFNPITDNDYNKIYLTNLQESQDTFDLRIVGGVLSFDYIVDPSSLYNFATCTPGTNCWASDWEVDVFPFGGSVNNVNQVVNAIAANYTLASSLNNQNYTTGNPGTGDEVVLFMNWTLSESVASISGINFTFCGATSSTTATNFGIYLLKADSTWSTNTNWVQVGTNESIAMTRVCFTRNLASDFSTYINAGGKIVWMVTEVLSAVNMRVDYVEMNVSYNPPDLDYPQFSEYWDDNGTVTDSGIGRFNTTVTSTNGTVILEINGQNVTASNNSGDATVFNATYNFAYGSNYSYRWSSWGNGTSANYNVSSRRNYTVIQTPGTFLSILYTNANVTATARFSATYTENNTLKQDGAGAYAQSYLPPDYTFQNITYKLNDTYNLSEVHLANVGSGYNCKVFSIWTSTDGIAYSRILFNKTMTNSSAATVWDNYSSFAPREVNYIKWEAREDYQWAGTHYGCGLGEIEFYHYPPVAAGGANPEVIIATPSNNTNWSVNTIDVNYTATDADGISSCWYSNDTYTGNTTLSGCGNITEVIWSEGQHNVTIWANDTNNNVGKSSVSFTIDSIKPNINITSPMNNSNSVDNNLDINYTVSDTNLASCWYSNDTMAVNISLAPSLIKNPINPVVKSDVAWEGSVIAEQSVILENGVFHMWYRGNTGTDSRIGYANSTDGINWIKHGSNPLSIPLNGSTAVYFPYVIKVDSVYYMFAVKFPGDDLYRFNSTNGINWSDNNGAKPILNHTTGWESTSIANPAVYYDANSPDGPWKMLYEATGTGYQIGYANSTNGINWSKYGSNPVIPIVPSTWKSTFVGNPYLTKIGDTYYAWYGGSDGTGWEIGWSKSVGNMTNWTDGPRNPEIDAVLPWEDTDDADMHILYNATGKTHETYMYYGGGQNSTGLAYIQGLTFQEYMQDATLPTCVNLTSAFWSLGQHNVTIWTNDTSGNVNYSTVSFTITLADNDYPQFSEYWDNNNSLTYSGLARFNTTITSTNGTVWLEINGENITAANSSGNATVFNATYNFSYGGIYSYKWHSWGNGTSANYNVSNIKNYSITQIFGNSDTDSNSEWTQYHRNLNQTAYYSDTVDMTGFAKLWNYTMGNWSYTSSPAISHDKVYIGAYDKKLYVLNATTGANLWNYTTGSVVRSSPAVSEDIVYFGSGDKRFYAVNATNGTQIWNYTTLDSIYASPTVYNGIVYIPSSDNNTYALNAYDGTYIWNYSCPREMMTSSPAVVDGVLYVGCHDYNVLAINASNGSKIWNYSTGGKVYSSPAVADGIVYIGSNSRKLYALYASNGSKIWEYGTGNLTYSSPAVYGGIVYVGIEGGIQNNSYVLAANATNGTHIWNQTVLDKIYSCPAVSNNAVFIGSNDNQTYAFDRVTGEKLWNYTTDGNVRSSPAIANGIVYIGSDDKNVYAFKATAATGANPVIIRVWNESLKDAVVDPVEYSISTGGVNDIPFTVTVTDIDGVAEINDSSIFVSFNTSNARRTNTTTCAKETGDANTTSQNYTCTVRMFYFDNNETWTIEVNASDTGNGSVISTGNQSKVFDYGFLKAFVLDPSFITWGSLNPGNTNLTSNQNTTLNNTGNVPINLGNIQVNAINLGGLRDNTQYLTVNNISSSWDGSVGMCGNSTNGILFVNATYISITNANLTRGNVSAANATTLGQEVLYYCIPKVPSITSQTYATNNSGSWTVRILLALLIPRKKKKKEIGNDKLLNAFDLIADELKEEYSLNKVELLEIIIEKLKGRYGISKKEVLQLIKSGEELEIPATIFSKELGCLEAISKYMKENLNMGYREIAKEIGRDERTIWTSYKKAKDKDKEVFQIKAKGLFLPISIFRNNKLTILESVIFYLKGKGMNYSKIAEILNRDQRNIWTTYSRLIKKMNKE